MGKNAKNKKRRREQARFSAAPLDVRSVSVTQPIGSDDDDDEVEDYETTQQQQIVTTAACLEELASNPTMFTSPMYRPVRAALYKVMQSGVWQGSSAPTTSSSALPTRSAQPSTFEQIAMALRLGDWEAAVSQLRVVASTKVVPKLGTLQRWVRECDGVFTSDKAHTEESQGAMKCLDAILRAADPASIGSISTSASKLTDTAAAAPLVLPEKRNACNLPVVEKKEISSMLTEYTPWDPLTVTHFDHCKNNNNSSSSSSSSSSLMKETINQVFTAAIIAPENRRPQNWFPLRIWSTSRCPFPALSPRTLAPALPCPFVRETCLLPGLLSPEECRQIVRFGEHLGFDPDSPVGNDSSSSNGGSHSDPSIGAKESTTAKHKQTSVLAHAFVWLADEIFISALWNRARPALAASSCLGSRMSTALGLNRRLRCYRYRPGSVYRPHIDGAWPPSGLRDQGHGYGQGEKSRVPGGNDSGHSTTPTPTPTTTSSSSSSRNSYSNTQDVDSYVYDSSQGSQLSQFTFLIYLNEDFDGGGTAFYAPRAYGTGLDRRAVRPREGRLRMYYLTFFLLSYLLSFFLSFFLLSSLYSASSL
jgi:hypothetical protein